MQKERKRRDMRVGRIIIMITIIIKFINKSKEFVSNYEKNKERKHAKKSVGKYVYHGY